MLQATSKPRAYLTLINGNSEEFCGVVDQQRMVIGRSSQCDISLPQRYARVSRRHAEILADGQGMRIRDLNSRHGTHVNGVWIKPPQEAPLVVGDRICLGGVALDVVSLLPRVNALPSSADSLLDETAGRGTGMLPAQSLLAELSQAEMAVVLWIGRGYFSDEEIAANLYRSPNTVRTQINSIFRKLGVRSRPEIISLLQNDRWSALTEHAGEHASVLRSRVPRNTQARI